MAYKTYVNFMLGHVIPGLLIFMLGVYHLLKNIKLHLINPKSYVSRTWFPSSTNRYLELYFAISIYSFYLALFMGLLVFFPNNIGPLQKLPNVEHCIIVLTFLVYSLFAIVLDKLNPPAAYDLTNLLFALGFGIEFLVFHLHSTTQKGFEGQYHWLLQLVIFVTFATSILSIKYTKSFLNGFVRSFSIVFQGVWLMVMGFMLYTPSLIPSGCHLRTTRGHWTVRCPEEAALHGAKSLATLQFSLCMIGVIVFAIVLYLIMMMFRSEKTVEYQSLVKFEEKQEPEQTC